MSSSFFTNANPTVLIVGAGPSGLIAALSLVKNGVPVRVIEKATTHRIGQRGAGLMPRSFEVFESLGFIDEVMKYAIDIPLMTMYKPGSGTEILREFHMEANPTPTPDRPFSRSKLLGQDRLDQILRPLLETFGVTVELGTELKAFEDVGDKVNVKIQKVSGETEEISYDYIIGADGARGIVRKGLGFNFIGETTETKMLVGEFDLEGETLSAERWHMWGHAADYLLTIRPTETPGRFTFVTGGGKLPNPADLTETEEKFKEYVKERTFAREDIKIAKIIWMGPYTVNIRMTESFRKGRVLITGDASHIHSPTGGQGMNTGVQDSYNIGWKLALVVKGLAPPSLLETVSEERIPVVAEMLDMTTHFMKTTLSKENTGDAWKRTGATQQLGVNYRTSPIVVDAGSQKEESRKVSAYGGAEGGHVYAGDRAPDAPGLVKPSSAEPVRLFKIFTPDRHTVIIFADKAAEIFSPSHAIFSKYPSNLVRYIVLHGAGKASTSSEGAIEVYEDRDGNAYNAYKGPEGVSNIFVVRPDGYVGARLGSLDEVEGYFKGIFGDN